MDLLFDRHNPLTSDIILREPTLGLTLSFDGHLQRLHLITVDVATVNCGEHLPDLASGCNKTGLNSPDFDDLEGSVSSPFKNGAVYSHKGHVFCNRGQASYFRQIYSLFGPTVPGDFSSPSLSTHKYFLNYLGCTFEVPLTPEQHSSFMAAGELPPDSLGSGTDVPPSSILLISRFHIYPRQVKNFPFHLQSMNAGNSSSSPLVPRLSMFLSPGRRFPPLLPPTPQSLPYGQHRLKVVVGKGIIVPSGSLLRFGSSAQRIFGTLGPCESTCIKDIDSLSTVGENALGSANHMYHAGGGVGVGSVGIFWSYPQLGMDFLMHPTKKTLLKIVLHVNLPAHENFGVSKRAFFDILANANFIQSEQGSSSLKRALESENSNNSSNNNNNNCMSNGQITHDITFMQGLASFISMPGPNSTGSQQFHSAAGNFNFMSASHTSNLPDTYFQAHEPSPSVLPVDNDGEDMFVTCQDSEAPLANSRLLHSSASATAPKILLVEPVHAAAKKKSTKGASSVLSVSSLHSARPSPTPTPSAPALMASTGAAATNLGDSIADAVPLSANDKQPTANDSSPSSSSSHPWVPSKSIDESGGVVEHARLEEGLIVSIPAALKLKTDPNSVKTIPPTDPSLNESETPPYSHPLKKQVAGTDLLAAPDHANHDISSLSSPPIPVSSQSPSPPVVVMNAPSVPANNTLTIAQQQNLLHQNLLLQHSSLPSSPSRLTPQASLTHSPPAAPLPPPSPPPLCEPSTIFLPPLPPARDLPPEQLQLILRSLHAIPIINETTTWRTVAALVADPPSNSPSSSYSSAPANSAPPPVTCVGVPLLPLVLRKEANRCPWGASRLYCLPGLSVEVVPSEHMATLTLTPSNTILPIFDIPI